MSIAATVTQHVAFSGDQSSEIIWNSGELSDSPCLQELVTLAVGNNTITVPAVDDFTVHGVALVPPTANTVEPVLKGVNGDTGITLSASQVSVVQLGAEPPASIVLNVAEELVGLRLVWF